MQSEAQRTRATKLAPNTIEQSTPVASVASRTLSTWLAVDAALSPIIGQRGVAALYKRSLHQVCASHPCMLPVYESAAHPVDFSALQAALSQQTAADAESAAAALQGTFSQLLTTLIGDSLTERLLRSALNNPSSSSGDAVQDTSP